MSAFQAITNIILPAGLYAFLLSLTPKIGKSSIWMSILFVFAAFQMVLLYMYGRSPIAVDMFLNVATTNPGEVGELLGNLLIIILFVILIFLPPIAMAIIAMVRKWRLGNKVLRITRKTALSLLAAGTIFFALSFTGNRTYKPLCDIYPLNIAYNLCTAVVRTIKTASYHETSAAYSFSARSLRPDSIPETYIVVIGETSRAGNWQLLGYERETNPELINRQDITAFSKAISQSNTTHKSVPMLLSALDATNFGDSIYTTKSLISAFKEAGFATTYITNHARNHSFIDFFGAEADTCIFVRDHNPDGRNFTYDTDMVPYLRQALARPGNKKLIVLHAYGSHFNYIDRYPAEFATFQPDRPSEATYHFRDRQINAYDNTIRFTSHFLNDVIREADRGRGLSGLIYTSDHGEDIFDDQRHLFLHASPIPSYYQLHVPLIIWLNDRFRTSYPDVPVALGVNANKYVATSAALFPTIMHMGGISTPKANPGQSLLNRAYTPGEPIYLNDHNEAVPLGKCGLLEEDFVKFDSLGIDLRR